MPTPSETMRSAEIDSRNMRAPRTDAIGGPKLKSMTTCAALVCWTPMAKRPV